MQSDSSRCIWIMEESMEEMLFYFPFSCTVLEINLRSQFKASIQNLFIFTDAGKYCF